MNHDQHTHPDPPGIQPQQRGRHGWMMLACCIPMLVIAVALVATGVVGPGFLVFAIAMAAIMVFMMRAMPGHEGSGHAQH